MSIDEKCEHGGNALSCPRWRLPGLDTDAIIDVRRTRSGPLFGEEIVVVGYVCGGGSGGDGCSSHVRAAAAAAAAAAVAT